MDREDPSIPSGSFRRSMKPAVVMPLVTECTPESLGAVTRIAVSSFPPSESENEVDYNSGPMIPDKKNIQKSIGFFPTC